tara:strand:+ start:9078 stop:9362 length:285 start_codon:yes stop_codon:yes gene_type:complete
MVRSEIIQKLCDLNPNLYRKDITKCVDLIVAKLIRELSSGSRIELRDLGIFYTKLRKSRTARNPKTGDKVNVPDKKFVRFKMSRSLRKEINKGE